MSIIKICLLGDFSDQVLAHQAILRSLQIAQDKYHFPIHFEWVQTKDIQNNIESQFKNYAAVWCVPASPYENTEGVLDVIHFVRTHNIAFLGTCGGYQHALIEYAQNVLGIENAEHAELTPNASNPIIMPLSCSLIEKSERVNILKDTMLSHLYLQNSFDEPYHCSFGFNLDYFSLFQSDTFKFSAKNLEGEVRAFELSDHPFFIGTAFQPERLAFDDDLHPIVKKFITVALSSRNK